VESGGVRALPKTQFVAMGVPSEDSSLRALAAAHGIDGVPAEAGSEGYVVAIDETSVFVLANTAAGVYYGATSLLQLAAVPQESPRCNLVDWPDFPIRGAYMFGGPKLTPDSPDPLQWHMNLADWMSQHKMNFGVVVAHFYDIVPSLVPNATAIRLLQAQMVELREFMEERYVQFVPTLASGSGGGPEYFNPSTAEGKWVQNGSFSFGSGNNGKDKDTLQPRGGTAINATAFNGDFALLSQEPSPPNRKVPTGWSYARGTAKGSGNAEQWEVVEGDAPWSSKSKRSLKCTMKVTDTPPPPSRLPYPTHSHHHINIPHTPAPAHMRRTEARWVPFLCVRSDDDELVYRRT
jgi:hypothetical protein